MSQDQKNWMVRNLRDGHVPEDSEYREKFRNTLLGVLCFPGRLPVVVSCGPVDYTGVLCLNEVYARNGVMHLSINAAVLINKEQLAKLKTDGSVVIDTMQGDPTVYLLKEVASPTKTEQTEDNELMGRS